MLGRGREADDAFEEFFERDTARGKVALALEPPARRAAAGGDRDAARRLARGREERRRHALSRARVLAREGAARRCRGAVAPCDDAGAGLHGRLDSARPRSRKSTSVTAEAIECYRTATQLEPGNAAAWAGLGLSYAHVGDVTQSITAFERSLALRDSAERAVELCPRAEDPRRSGRALREYRAAIALKPDFGEVVLEHGEPQGLPLRATPRSRRWKQQLKREDLSRERRHPFPVRARQGLRGCAGTTTAPGSYYHTGNQRQRPQVSYDPVGFELRHEEIAEVFSREFFEQHAGAGISSRDAPIFIVGLPRSGSTLIEQILASHSQVEGTLELPTLGEIAVSIGRYRRGPQASIPTPCASCAAGTSAPTGSSTSTRRGSSARPASRASPTSCRTTSRTSASRT